MVRFKDYLHAVENALQAGNATEHTHRPALKALLESLDLQVTATNEPQRIACGAPDYIITRNGLTVGYIEAKDVGKSLAESESTDQLKRYRSALDNLILTDYLEFRWYVGGELRQEARLARPQTDGKLKIEKDSLKDVAEMLQNFLVHEPQAVNTPKDLAERLARLTHIVRDIIIAAFAAGQASLLLQGWREAFARVLIADLNLPEKTSEFADMFAQTLAYGLFTARMMDDTATVFTRQTAQYLIPKSNPFLRDFFIQITGPQLDDEPFASFVNDLVDLLNHTDMEAVLTDFGRRTRREDPIVHFYETFLAAYDPKLREARGVYSTPEPVVSYIVRSVDALLKTRFNCPQGLADSSTVTIPNANPGRTVKGKKQPRKTTESHKVLILDPVTGTGTFLYFVIDHIRGQFMQQGNAGMWPGYVKNHLLPRLFGFELLMAPYAVAHFKLSLQLAGHDLPEALRDQWAYHPADGERLGVFLTNSLEEAHEMTGLPLFTQWVADESNAANEVKTRLPVLVVMGNPPYSGHSANKSDWISGLLRGKLPEGGKTGNYYEVDGQPLGERNPKWLQDDYVKFIRFGQWRIEQSGQGILAFITNHGYLDNPTFRGMRQSLMQTFTDIYILNLHGNAKKRETAPDGGKDENVFDIQQGVAIGIFVKQPGKNDPTNVYHADLSGTRAKKYEQLFEQDVEKTDWQLLKPQPPFYLFSPQNVDLLGEYNRGRRVTDIFPLNSVGVVTGQDGQTIGFTVEETQRLANSHNLPADFVKSYTYRPFDTRHIVYDGQVVTRQRFEVMRHMIASSNVGLTVGRSGAVTGDEEWNLAYASSQIPDFNLYRRGGVQLCPLYLYPTENAAKQKSLLDVAPWPADEAHGGRTPNLNPKFVAEMAQKLSLTFTPNAPGDSFAGSGLQPEPFVNVLVQSARLNQPLGLNQPLTTFGPEDIFHYIYAIFHSPTYRSRYAEFLKIDFPRVPLTSDVDLFRTLCGLGKELVGLHLLESPQAGQFITRYPVAGDNRVEKGYPQYVPPQDDRPGRININKSQSFEGIAPDVWEFHIGGYQVLDKWLKDRQGRQLSHDDLTHYQQVVVVLQKTIALMDKIDSAIPKWPIE